MLTGCHTVMVYWDTFESWAVGLYMLKGPWANNKSQTASDGSITGVRVCVSVFGGASWHSVWTLPSLVNKCVRVNTGTQWKVL